MPRIALSSTNSALAIGFRGKLAPIARQRPSARGMTRTVVEYRMPRDEFRRAPRHVRAQATREWRPSHPVK